MDPIELVRVVDDAVTASAGTRSGDAYWERLGAATGVGFMAADLALGMVGADLPAVRATGCDLVGVACNGDDGPHRWAAMALAELAGREADDDVVLSIAGALMHVRDPIAIPVLVAFAANERSEVRLRAAMALPAAMGDGDDNSGVEALIQLSADGDA